MPLVNLNKRLERQDRISRTKSKRSLKKLLIRLFIILLILGVFVYLPLRGVYQSGRKMVASARAMNESFKQGNLDSIKGNIKDMREASNSLNTSLFFLVWVRIIPFAGGFYADAVHFAKAGGYELQAAETLVSTLDPYKNELGLNGTPVAGTDKVAQMVKILEEVIPQIDKVEPQIKKAADEVSSVDVDKYPENFGKYHLRAQVDAAKNFIMGAHYAITEAKDAVLVAPKALGTPDKKTYLLIFQNDKELRPTGGFMTAYAFLTLDKGRVSSSISDDIYRLDEKLLDVCRNKICPLTPPEPLVKYLPEANGKPRTAWSMRDSNLSPDIPTSLKDFEKMYNMLGDGQSFDGIILIDTNVVEELIKITGPIDVLGTTYSAEKDSRCDCPNVIYELEAYAQIIEKGEKDRKAILGTLMQQILARSLGAATDKLPEFINTGVKLATDKSMIFYMKDTETQKALSKLNWTGEIRPYTYDYLHINDANFAGGKSNLYVEEKVELDTTIKDGKVTHKLVIDYSNPRKYDSWLNQRNRDYLRIYVPKGAKLISSKGSDVKVETKEDLGRTYFEAFVEVRPENSRKIEFEYELPNKLQGNEYNLLIQKQPGSKDFEYTVKVNGKQKEKFNLETDKDLKISI